MKLLIIEDEKELSDSIVSYLRTANYVCEVAPRYHDAISRIENFDYDCIVLDIGLPDGSGLNLLKELKDNYKNEGVIILSAKNSIDDRITGLNMGADDYLPKPFAFSELIARVRALGRRTSVPLPPVLERAGIKLDPNRREVFRDGKEVQLAPKEFAVLEVLMRSEGAVVSAEQLLEKAWDENTDPFTNVVRVTVMTLRRKLGEPAVIVTVPGSGYRI